tara:strand:+ start:7769 stop:8416 length:648 start_codon:yes stop_codon:yes gene_type:complete
MNSYMPEHGVETNTSNKNDYLKFTNEGTYRFRVMGILGDKYNFIHGYIAWDNEEKPHREAFVEGSKGSPELIAKDRDKEPKYFWTFVVIFVSATDKDNNPILQEEFGKPKIVEIAQKTIQQGVSRLLNDVDWGNPKDYDITINRVGKLMETKYFVNAKPKSPITQEMHKAVDDARIDLRVLFEGGQPFGALNSEENSIESPNEQLARIANSAMNK